jgi:hypothetical protein
MRTSAWIVAGIVLLLAIAGFYCVILPALRLITFR